MHSCIRCVNILSSILLHIAITKIEKYIYQIYTFMHIYLKIYVVYTQSAFGAFFFFHLRSWKLKFLFLFFCFIKYVQLRSYQREWTHVLLNVQHLILLEILLSICIFRYSLQYFICYAERQMINLLIFSMPYVQQCCQSHDAFYNFERTPNF